MTRLKHPILPLMGKNLCLNGKGALVKKEWWSSPAWKFCDLSAAEPEPKYGTTVLPKEAFS